MSPRSEQSKAEEPAMMAGNTGRHHIAYCAHLYVKNEILNVDHWVNNKHPNHLPVVWTPSSEQSKAVKEPGTGDW